MTAALPRNASEKLLKHAAKDILYLYFLTCLSPSKYLQMKLLVLLFSSNFML